MDDMLSYMNQSIKEFEEVYEAFKKKDFSRQKRLSRKFLKKHKMRLLELEELIENIEWRLEDKFFPRQEKGYDEDHYTRELYNLKDEHRFVKRAIIHFEDEFQTATDFEKSEKELRELELLQLKIESKKAVEDSQLDKIINLAIKGLKRENRPKAKQFLREYNKLKRDANVYNETDYVREIGWPEPSSVTQKNWMDKFDEAEKLFSNSD